MNRRGFLQACLAAATAPYVVTAAGVLMPARTIWTPSPDLFGYDIAIVQGSVTVVVQASMDGVAWFTVEPRTHMPDVNYVRAITRLTIGEMMKFGFDIEAYGRPGG